MLYDHTSQSAWSEGITLAMHFTFGVNTYYKFLGAPNSEAMHLQWEANGLLSWWGLLLGIHLNVCCMLDDSDISAVSCSHIAKFNSEKQHSHLPTNKRCMHDFGNRSPESLWSKKRVCWASDKNVLQQNYVTMAVPYQLKSRKITSHLYSRQI